MYKSRYRRIVLFFARIIISSIFWDLFLPRIGFRKSSLNSRPRRFRKYAISFRSLAIQMGGVLIKVGQFLSSRVDILPKEITDELAGLQDEVPPVKFDAIRQVIEDELGNPLTSFFLTFDEKPLAAASLGQVHRATITSTYQVSFSKSDSSPLTVAVKVQRPNIDRIIETDLSALQTVGNWLHRYRPIRKHADVPELLKEFAIILREETDYENEARNAETFAKNFSDDPNVRVPEVVWSLTTRRVLTLEDVWAIKITDYQAITQAGISRSEVASRLLNTYLQQIFEDAFFHADPHPGNLFVNPLPPPTGFEYLKQTKPKWQLTFVDFGMVGKIPPNLRTGLRELLIGVGTQDASRVVKAYQMLDVLLPDADIALIEKAEAKVFERFWGKNMTELMSISTEEMHEFANDYRELIYTMPFQVPQNIIFLARAVGILSGMCTGLDPNFNVWDHLAPFAQKLIADEVRMNREVWLDEFMNIARALLSVPPKMQTILDKMDRGDISVHTPEVTRQTQRIEGALQQVVVGIIFGALLLSGTQLFLEGKELLSYIFFTGAGISLIGVWRIARRQRNNKI